MKKQTNTVDPKAAVDADPNTDTDTDTDDTSSGTDSSEEEESPSDYCKGGYHPVSIGDIYENKYEIIRKLGWGHFSTVWLGTDITHCCSSSSSCGVACRRICALKIVKSAENYTETALDEIKLLERVRNNGTTSASSGREFVVELYNSFRLSGPNGNHLVMVFEVLGPNLLSLIKSYNHKGIPTRIVKRITKQICSGLDYLHAECGIIHTDLKPENILMCLRDLDSIKLTLNEQNKKTAVVEKAKSAVVEKTDIFDQAPGLTSNQKKKLRQKAKKLASKLANLNPKQQDVDMEPQDEDMDGPPSPIKYRAELPPTPPSKKSGNREVRDTESIEESSAGSVEEDAMDTTTDIVIENIEKVRLASPNPKKADTVEPTDEEINVKIADLGNSCWVDRHFTSDIQTRQYRSPEVILGQKYGVSADIWSLGCIVFELLTGDFLFDPKTGDRYSKDDDHAAQISELVGPFPKRMAGHGKFADQIFNRKGQLRHIRKLRPWPLTSLLYDRYGFKKEAADQIAAFIEETVRIVPEDRKSAAELLTHSWLSYSCLHKGAEN